MNCLVCGRDTGDNGTDKAVAVFTNGSSGSTVLDNDGTVRFSVCDHCLVERRDRLRLVVRNHCESCGASERRGIDLIDVPEDVIPRVKPSNLVEERKS